MLSFWGRDRNEAALCPTQPTPLYPQPTQQNMGGVFSLLRAACVRPVLSCWGALINKHHLIRHLFYFSYHRWDVAQLTTSARDAQEKARSLDKLYDGATLRVGKGVDACEAPGNRGR